MKLSIATLLRKLWYSSMVQVHSFLLKIPMENMFLLNAWITLYQVFNVHMLIFQWMSFQTRNAFFVSPCWRHTICPQREGNWYGYRFEITNSRYSKNISWQIGHQVNVCSPGELVRIIFSLIVSSSSFFPLFIFWKVKIAKRIIVLMNSL